MSFVAPELAAPVEAFATALGIAVPDAGGAGVVEFQASGREWRTPPLWGVGLFRDVNGHQRLLHDGRANGVLEAVLWHGGEAQVAKDQVLKFNQRDREALVKFVESL